MTREEKRRRRQLKKQQQAEERAEFLRRLLSNRYQLGRVARA